MVSYNKFAVRAARASIVDKTNQRVENGKYVFVVAVGGDENKLCKIGICDVTALVLWECTGRSVRWRVVWRVESVQEPLHGVCEWAPFVDRVSRAGHTAK